MQTASAKWLPAIFFTIKKNKILGANPDAAWAWAQCWATIRTAERCRNTAGRHIHVEPLKSFWAVYPFRGHLEGVGAHPSCIWAEAGSTPRWVANSPQGLVWALGFWEAHSGVPQQCCEGVWAPPPTTRTLGLEPTTLHFTVQPPTDWATTTPDFGVQKWRKTMTWLQNYSGCLFPPILPAMSSYYGNHGTNRASVKPGLYSSLSPSALCKSMLRQGV